MGNWTKFTAFISDRWSDRVRRKTVAYEFESDLTVREMLPTLNLAGPWQWEERDTVWYKDDLSAVVSERAIVRIYDEGKSFNLSFFYKGPRDQARKEWDQIQDVIISKVLPALRARNIERTTCHDPPAAWWKT